MGRLSCLLLAAFCVGVVAVRGDEWTFPDPFKWGSPPPADAPPPPLYPSPEAPSPYYDAPPYMGGEPPVESPPPSYGPEPSPWLSCGLWAQRTEQWSSPWTADTSIGDAFGSDALTVYGQVSMLDGLTAKGDDGYTDLLKEGITALLNAVDAHFKYTEDDIKKCFSFKTSLSSEAAATKQADLFKAANDAYSSP